MSRLTEWFKARAEHFHLEFIPEPGSAPLVPGEGYLCVWLAEGFLAERVTWGNEHFPALHGGVTLDVLGGEPSSFTTVTSASWSVPGVHLDQRISPLVPYHGGVVSVEAGLFQASQQGPLGAAVRVLGKLAGLVGPPLAGAATLATKMSEGFDLVLEATGDQPKLGVHWSMVAPGGGGRPVQAGHLVVIGASAPPGPLTVVGGRLRANGEPLEVDYLMVRIECRAERHDAITPELRALVDRAVDSALRGDLATMDVLRKEAVIKAWTSKDLVERDRIRVATKISADIEKARTFGIVPAEAGDDRLPSRDDPALRTVSLSDLLG